MDSKSAAVHKMVLMAVVMLPVGRSAYAQRPTTDDGVRLITQELAARGGVTTGDAPGFPVTISESGSYRLASNPIVPDGNTTAIDITAANVVMDLNGFSILGPGTPGSGVGIRAARPAGLPGDPPAGAVSVLNGVVRGMGGAGIRLGPSCRVEGVHALQNGVGVETAQGCRIVNNNVNINGIGIQTGGGATVIGNTVKNNTGLGMTLGDAGYAHNVVTGNNGGNANPQVTGGIQMGGNICGSALCP